MSENLLTAYKRSVEETLRMRELCEATSNEERRRALNALLCPQRRIELFQYRKCTKECLEGLKQGSIRFKAPMQFNDPFDSMIYWRKEVVDPYFEDDKFKDALKKLCLWDAECVAMCLSWCFRISCFSEISNSPIMWAHYADACKGFCVGYEMHPAFEEVMDIGSGADVRRCVGAIFPVIYTDRRIDATKAMIREIEYVVAAEMGRLKELDLSRYDELEPYKTSLFKSKDWAYEREWRIVLRGFDGRDRRDWLLPSENITKVIYGPKMSTSDMIEVGKALREYAAWGQRPIKTQRMFANWQDDKYVFEVEDCGYVPVPGKW